ncbi:LysM domain-containing protein [Mobilisporobacter senegalensis]|uniref:LysM domain-containing protein n=1 Tax=Mobilisporobacter senegalensis TaxID=1329262 RepID=A0A3N1XSN2_9FIRM|nr:LysM peptidoglycan-binding domain-containing protein [Mobilisporobacter senegalensis]ROR29258.1 LysM domain-containing protein [Mobilisporobacter senegalensis]
MNRRVYRNSLLMKRIALIITVTIITIIALLIFIFPKKIVVNAGDNNRTKTVTSVLIKKGDSLWSIAGQYMTEEYSDRNEYIQEIKECNGLTSDTIHEDQYLIIPHYVEL